MPAKSFTEKPNPKKLPIFSYSKFNAYKNCPKQYYYHYIEKKPTLDKPYTIFGQFCHEILENFHKEYIGKDPIDMDVVMKSSFLAALKNWKPKLLKEQITEAMAIMQSYLDILCNTSFPNVQAVEQEIWLPIDDQFILYGFIDRVDQEGDKIHVVDYKTTQNEKYLKDKLQLLLYAYYFNKEKNVQSIKGSFMLLKHKMKMLSEEFTIDEIIKAKNKTLAMFHQIREDKLYRANPTFLCNNCDFSSFCKEGMNILKKDKTTGEMEW